MTVATVASRALAGIDAPEVTVEVHLGPGLPAFHIVGLPDTEVREARDRVRAALNHAHFEFPARRITVNLAPADLPKESGRFDLPIALGILAASGQLATPALERRRSSRASSRSPASCAPVRGALAMALSARAAGRAFVLPEGNAPQAALAEGARILPARIAARGLRAPRRRGAAHASTRASRASERARTPDFSDVKGQQQAKRALEVAAAGGHSVLMIGPARHRQVDARGALPGHPAAADARTKRSKSPRSTRSRRRLRAARWGERPFRAPHHSASARGAGRRRRAAAPGRDLARAPRRAVPRRAAGVRPRRARGAARAARVGPRLDLARRAPGALPGALPARRGDEPLPVRHCGDRSGRCRCTPERIARYRGRISGPLADRIDLKLEVPAPREAELVARGRRRGLGGDPRARRDARGACSSRARASRTRCSARARSTGIAPPTARATSCCATRSRGCCSRRAPTTACCAWRAPSPTSPAGTPSPRSTSPRRSSTGASTPASNRAFPYSRETERQIWTL